MQPTTPQKSVMDALPAQKPDASNGAEDPQTAVPVQKQPDIPASLPVTQAATSSQSLAQPPLEVHPAPSANDADDTPIPPRPETPPSRQKPPAVSDVHALPKVASQPQGPALAVAIALLCMVVLSAVAVIIYLNA